MTKERIKLEKGKFIITWVGEEIQDNDILESQILSDYEIVNRLRERIDQYIWMSDKDDWEEKVLEEFEKLLGENNE